MAEILDNREHELQMPSRAFPQHIPNVLADLADRQNKVEFIWGISSSTFSTDFVKAPTLSLIFHYSVVFSGITQAF